MIDIGDGCVVAISSPPKPIWRIISTLSTLNLHLNHSSPTSPAFNPNPSLNLNHCLNLILRYNLRPPQHQGYDCFPGIKWPTRIQLVHYKNVERYAWREHMSTQHGCMAICSLITVGLGSSNQLVVSWLACN